jgi:transcriptional regulator with XRE-family HTH domain
MKMSKRTTLKIPTKESKALKKMRNLAGLSLRKLSDSMKVSFALVHQKEEGRSEINKEYVSKFLLATDFKQSDWEDFIKQPSTSKKTVTCKLKQDCLNKLNSLSVDQLQELNIAMRRL